MNPPFPRVRLRWVLVAAVLAVLIALALAFVSAPQGPAIEGIEVSMPQNSELTAQAVREAAAPAVHGGLLALNLAAVRELVEALPWVRHAELRRVWPDALAITIRLEHPVARWGAGSLMDDSGRIFTPASLARYAALPEISGPPGDAAALLQEFTRTNALLAPLGLRASSLAEDGRGGIHIELTGGLSIELGRKAPRAMLARFVTVVAPALGTALARAATVDMRYPNGFAVGWKGEAQHG